MKGSNFFERIAQQIQSNNAITYLKVEVWLRMNFAEVPHMIVKKLNPTTLPTPIGDLGCDPSAQGHQPIMFPTFYYGPFLSKGPKVQF